MREAPSPLGSDRPKMGRSDGNPKSQKYCTNDPRGGGFAGVRGAREGSSTGARTAPSPLHSAPRAALLTPQGHPGTGESRRSAIPSAHTQRDREPPESTPYPSLFTLSMLPGTCRFRSRAGPKPSIRPPNDRFSCQNHPFPRNLSQTPPAKFAKFPTFSEKSLTSPRDGANEIDSHAPGGFPTHQFP